ncbi:MAG: IclR family transcriptional regulator [Desulfobacteraceae bacterium]|nr:IclR family transcriptional regulator [Desulfobacteraceae bacterium]
MVRNRRLIQSIKRASDILDVFVQEKKAHGITDFSKKLQLPKTTIQGIVQTLEALSYLEKDSNTPKYRLGPKVFQLGMLYATNMDIVTMGKVWMERLSFQIREPVNLGMLVGNKVVVVLRVDSENSAMLYPQAGSIIPLHATCIGKILLSHLDQSQRMSILSDHNFEKFTPNTIPTLEKFLKEIERIPKQRVSFENQESVIGMAGIGAPIFNHTNKVIAAFAVTGESENILKNKNKIVEAVEYTSIQVSKQLGCSGSL